MPGVMSGGNVLFVAYVVQSNGPSENDEFAVVKFSGVCQHKFGYPNDEALGGHPYFGLGLKLYAFNVLVNSPYLRVLGEANSKAFPGSESKFKGLIHWIVTFHDETLEVVGRSAEVVGRAEAGSAIAAIRTIADRQPEVDGPAKRSFAGS